MEKDNDIEDLFKKSFDKFEPEVRPKVWDNVKVGLKWGSLGMFLNALMNKVGTTTLIAIVTSAVVGTVAVVNMNKDEKGPIADKTVSTLPTTDHSNKQTPTEPVKTDVTEPANSTIETSEENSKTALVDESVANISANMLSGAAPLILDLSNTGTGKTNKWIFSDSKKASTLATPVHIFENPGKYTVKLISTDAQGKQDIDVVSVEVTESVPTIYKFSPDNDGISDTLKLDPKGIASIDAKVFDKDGNLVYESEGATGAYWDGKDLQGKESPKGNYFLTIKATTPKGKKVEQKGIVKLIK